MGVMYKHDKAAEILKGLDLGSSVAELDTLLETARVETSVFSDLIQDSVDLVPGTKGSGKSALFRIFVEFLPKALLKDRKVIIAHGVQKQGDNVFQAYREQFDKLTEDDFVCFWCIYLVSLAHEQFIKGQLYAPYLQNAFSEVEQFRNACARAKIPEITAKKSLRDILAWSLNVLRSWKPTLRYKLPNEGGDVEFDLFGKPTALSQSSPADSLDVPTYISDIKDTLEVILQKTSLSMWLMIDKLDEIFLRRSDLEARALRGLLRATRLFATPLIRVKIFLRDDMLEQIVSQGDGFTALTHITARQSDTLRWTEEQILTMLVKRLFANEALCQYLQVDKDRLNASQDYRTECFYRVFPLRVHSGPNQSNTLRWIYHHTMDGKGVVTPRDVIDLVTKAKQAQVNKFQETPDMETPHLIGPEAILYGLQELSKRKRDTYLKAEFPHLWKHIEKFVDGKSEYTEAAIRSLLGQSWEKVCKDLVSIGLIRKVESKGSVSYVFPYVYRYGLGLARGRA